MVSKYALASKEFGIVFNLKFLKDLVFTSPSHISKHLFGSLNGSAPSDLDCQSIRLSMTFLYALIPFGPPSTTTRFMESEIMPTPVSLYCCAFVLTLNNCCRCSRLSILRLDTQNRYLNTATFDNTLVSSLNFRSFLAFLSSSVSF